VCFMLCVCVCVCVCVYHYLQIELLVFTYMVNPFILVLIIPQELFTRE
jgi:hypothetical protein